MANVNAETLDLREKSRTGDGHSQTLDRRLFMQLLAFGGSEDSTPLIDALMRAQLPSVLYEDVNDPYGVALLTFNESPDFFLTDLRRFLRGLPFRTLIPKPEYTMFGRTYAQGDEKDLTHSLLVRPRQRACDPKMPWAIWYPLRRRGAFEQLSADDQRVILMEHGGVGHAYGRAGLGTDIRLACYGLDKNDNDFVIGLVGSELYPLSSLVQRMRKTKQTSIYLERLGPFFIGKAIFRQNSESKQ
jgi:chlorite dismutase